MSRLHTNPLTCHLSILTLLRNILFKYQFGFRKGYSIEQAILEITDNLKWAIDNKQSTCGLFLDFSKAVDRAKLYAYGVRGLPFQWFENYLKDRTQCNM